MLVNTHMLYGALPSVLGSPVLDGDDRYGVLGIVDKALPERFRRLHGGSERRGDVVSLLQVYLKLWMAMWFLTDRVALTRVNERRFLLGLDALT